jgi:hypothetical protein
MIDKNEFGYQMREALIALYGSDFTLRGVKLDEFRYGLAKMPPGEAFEKAKRDMTGWVAEEIADVGREYELYLHEHVENTRSARMAATAPSQSQWAVIIRQQNSLARQLERKIRLLMELQRERKSEARESLEASSPPDPSDPQDGATRVPSCRCRTHTPAASHPSATGMAQTSSCEVCDVPKGQAGTGNSIQPFPAEHGGVLHEERATTPIAGGTAALLIFLGVVLAAAFKNIKNRGNELKDLLQRQGIAEIAASKRTHFRAEKAAIGAPESGVWKRCCRKRNDSAGQSSRSCPSTDGHPETMKITRRWTDVVRASRPLWHGHPARARERDAPATAGETPALRFSNLLNC